VQKKEASGLRMKDWHPPIGKEQAPRRTHPDPVIWKTQRIRRKSRRKKGGTTVEPSWPSTQGGSRGGRTPHEKKPPGLEEQQNGQASQAQERHIPQEGHWGTNSKQERLTVLTTRRMSGSSAWVCLEKNRRNVTRGQGPGGSYQGGEGGGNPPLDARFGPTTGRPAN